MKFILLKSCLFSVLLCACAGEKDYAAFVDPFIGTGGHGHTYPGVSLPNGMVQVSPDTRIMGWDACSGYHYSDSTIIGFSHTHLSGTGIGDYGDILFMPVADCPHMRRGGKPSEGYRSSFSHTDEVSMPGYYSVKLDKYGIFAELTATQRSAMHRYTFSETDNASVIVDLSHTLHNHSNTELRFFIVSDTQIAGMKRTKGWAKDHPVYFFAEFSKPFEAEVFRNGKLVEGREFGGRDLKARLNFSTEKDEQILARVGISAVDIDGARMNMETEQDGADFDELAAAARKKWNECLSVIDVETKDSAAKKIFYTALYHCYLSPNVFSDVDGRYRGQDRKIHHTEGIEYYTVFSLWDTFRALHPLMTITDPQLNRTFVETLIRKYREGGFLPKWDLASNYTGTMIGAHAVSVIAESYVKGLLDGMDEDELLEACINSMTYRTGLDETGIANIDKVVPKGLFYRDSLGYIPSDKEIESVAKALEFAYNDWCIAEMAKQMGKDDICREYMERAGLYRNYFDKETGFMRGRLSDGSWREPFDPRHSNHRKDDYCEGNAWQWSWFVPHDIDGLVSLHGGKEQFITKLDSLFSVSSEMTGENVSGDISGLIGQYAHGNEPSHHIVHIYNYLGEGFKTQELVDYILGNLYFDDPNGLAGNEDCGQMSAWYVLNSIGFYPISPVSGEYSFGRPLFDRVTIRPRGGKEICITVHGNSSENKYIRSLAVNGKECDRMFISHKELSEGADIDIHMTDTPE